MLTLKINEFLDTLNRRPKTIRAYRNALKQFVAAAGVNADLTTESAIIFLQTLKHHAPATQHAYASALRKLYRFHNVGNDSELEKAIDHFCREIETSIVTFNREGIEKIIDYATQDLNRPDDLRAMRDRAAILSYVDTGLRLEELSERKVGDIDFLEMRAIISGKNKTQDIVRFSDRAIKAIRQYLTARAHVEPNTRKPLQSQPLFCDHDIRARKTIKKISSGGLRSSIKGRMEEAGVDPATVRIHDFRHYLITQVYLGTGNPKITQRISRHKSPAMLDRYVHFESEVDLAYEKVINNREDK